MLSPAGYRRPERRSNILFAQSAPAETQVPTSGPSARNILAAESAARPTAGRLNLRPINWSSNFRTDGRVRVLKSMHVAKSAWTGGKW